VKKLALEDPRVRLALGVLGLAVSGMSVKRDRVGRTEERIFRAINQLPDALYTPTWLVMQGGNLGTAPAATAVAYLAGRPSLAWRLLMAGSTTWFLAKGVKRWYRRPRPNALLASAQCRGREEYGLGYVSGHAGLAVALAVQAYPHLGPAGRRAVLVAVPIIGLSRVYVGAHLPLDIVGGAALGLAVDAVIALYPVTVLPQRRQRVSATAQMPALPARTGCVTRTVTASALPGADSR
jgi:undecaprenyl-diphosphatase